MSQTAEDHGASSAAAPSATAAATAATETTVTEQAMPAQPLLSARQESVQHSLDSVALDASSRDLLRESRDTLLPTSPPSTSITAEAAATTTQARSPPLHPHMPSGTSVGAAPPMRRLASEPGSATANTRSRSRNASESTSTVVAGSPPKASPLETGHLPGQDDDAGAADRDERNKRKLHVENKLLGLVKQLTATGASLRGSVSSATPGGPGTGARANVSISPSLSRGSSVHEGSGRDLEEQHRDGIYAGGPRHPAHARPPSVTRGPTFVSRIAVLRKPSVFSNNSGSGFFRRTARAPSSSIGVPDGVHGGQSGESIGMENMGADGEKKMVGQDSTENDQQEEQVAMQEDDRSSVTTEASHSYVAESFDYEVEIEPSVDGEVIEVTLVDDTASIGGDVATGAGQEPHNYLNSANLGRLAQQLDLNEAEKNGLKRDATILGVKNYLESINRLNLQVNILENTEDIENMRQSLRKHASENVNDVILVEKKTVHIPAVVEVRHKKQTRHHRTLFVKPEWRKDRFEDKGEERSATWLELFHDIFYAAALSRLSHAFQETPNAAFDYILIFMPLWWAWHQIVLYANRFDTDDVIYRLLSLVQMVAMVVFAINYEDAIYTTSNGYVISYSIIRATLAVKYCSVLFFDVRSRKTVFGYALCNMIAFMLWMSSLSLEPGYGRMYLWYASMVVDLVVQIIARGKKIPFSSSHLPERFGLFSILIFAEFLFELMSVIEIAPNFLDNISDTRIIVVSCLTVVTLFCLWWIYFDDFSGAVVGKSNYFSLAWIYAHIPLHVSNAYLGVITAGIIKSLVKGQDLQPAYVTPYLITAAAAIASTALIKVVSQWPLSLKDYGPIVIVVVRLLVSVIFLALIPIKDDGIGAVTLLIITTSLSITLVVGDVVVQVLESRSAERGVDDVDEADPSIESGSTLAKRNPSIKHADHQAADSHGRSQVPSSPGASESRHTSPESRQHLLPVPESRMADASTSGVHRRIQMMRKGSAVAAGAAPLSADPSPRLASAAAPSRIRNPNSMGLESTILTQVESMSENLFDDAAKQ